MDITQVIDSQVTLVDYLVDIGYLSGKPRLPVSISCPLHRDRHPSFRLYTPETRGGYCFSCGKSYTAFFMHYHLNGKDYHETIEYFKHKYSIVATKAVKTQKTLQLNAKAKQRLSQIVSNIVERLRVESSEEILRKQFQIFDTNLHNTYKGQKNGN